MKFKWFVGIDVSKETFDLGLRTLSGGVIHKKYSNSKKGVQSFLKDLQKDNLILDEGLICLEHTGIYTHVLLDILYSKGAKVWLVHALSIKRSMGLRRGKNDKVDALRIAEYADRFSDECVLWKPTREEIKKLKRLISLRFRLIKTKKLLNATLLESSDMKAIEFKDVKKLTSPIIKKIDIQLAELEKQINEVISSDEYLNRLEEIITSVDGVGKVTAWQMIITTNEFKNFKSARQFACYSGVVPFEHSSGSSINSKPRVSHFANKQMKELLHMSALSATIMKGELNDYYRRKVAEGKNKMLVLNNIRNKLTQRIFACVSQNRKYEKSYMNILA